MTATVDTNVHHHNNNKKLKLCKETLNRIGKMQKTTLPINAINTVLLLLRAREVSYSSMRILVFYLYCRSRSFGVKQKLFPGLYGPVSEIEPKIGVNLKRKILSSLTTKMTKITQKF